MSQLTVPETFLTRRERQQALHPDRRGPAAAPVRVPAPARVTSQPKRLSVTALLLGLSSILLGFTVIVPVAGIAIGVLAVGREPTRKGLSGTGIVAAVTFGAAWAALTPAILAILIS